MVTLCPALSCPDVWLRATLGEVVLAVQLTLPPAAVTTIRPRARVPSFRLAGFTSTWPDGDGTGVKGVVDPGRPGSGDP